MSFNMKDVQVWLKEKQKKEKQHLIVDMCIKHCHNCPICPLEGMCEDEDYF